MKAPFEKFPLQTTHLMGLHNEYSTLLDKFGELNDLSYDVTDDFAIVEVNCKTAGRPTVRQSLVNSYSMPHTLVRFHPFFAQNPDPRRPTEVSREGSIQQMAPKLAQVSRSTRRKEGDLTLTIFSVYAL